MPLSRHTFFLLLYAWMGLALVTFLLLLRVKAPYGRHTTTHWGPVINNRLGWFVMEFPVLFMFSYLFFRGDAEKSAGVWIIYGLFMVHYTHRVFIFPLRLRGKNKKMPLLIVLLAISFNLCNGFFNGYWLGHLNTFDYGPEWLRDWRFIAGVILFIGGMYLNMASDQRLINLRKGGKTGYFIPQGGWFNFVSSPNLLGEIIEWSGWALMSWCLPTLSFALWTMANLVPRALDHHKWYKERFKDYPPKRKAIFPFII